MAAFVCEDPKDKAAFDAHWDKILNSSQNTTRTIVAGGQVAGHMACHPHEKSFTRFFCGNYFHMEINGFLGDKSFRSSPGTKQSSLFSPGVVAVLLQVSRQRMSQLIHDGHVQAEPFQGARFGPVRSALNYAKARYRRKQLRMRQQEFRPH